MSTSPEVSAAEAAEVAAAMEEKRVDPYVTELPDSFEDSIVRMGRSTLQCMDEVRRNAEGGVSSVKHGFVSSAF